MTARTDTQQLAYAGRHRQLDTQPIALPPVAPMHGRLSRPLRPVPMPPPTDVLPALRLLPPVAPDGADRLRLTPFGRKVRTAAIALLALGACLALAVATRGTVVTWDGLLSVSEVVR